MTFSPNCVYHVFNRTFERHLLFFNQGNYEYFIDKVGQLRAYCDILAYCLMPTHFHLMIHAPLHSKGLLPVVSGSPLSQQVLTRKIGSVLSSYTRGINRQQGRVGSLFQPKTKALLLDADHAGNCFHYIHQNSLASGMVSRLEAWPHSSFNEYSRRRQGLCNKIVAAELLGVDLAPTTFRVQAHEPTRYNSSTNFPPSKF